MTSPSPNAAAPLARIARDGLWHHNAALVRLLGLCPLLAVSTTVVNGLALGVATLAVITVSNGMVSLLRATLRPETRIALFVLIIATLVTLVDMAMAAWFYPLHEALGIFVPLIVTNCAVLARAENFASRHAPLPSVVDGLATGAGFAAVLVLLGSVRELVGHGTLLRDAELLFGPGAAGWLLQVPAYDGFLLALLPPGAFFALALAVAARNAASARHTTATSRTAPAPANG